MRFAYMDEAGNTGRDLDQKEQPVHVIGTVIVDESKVMDIHDHLQDITRRRFPHEQHNDAFEFHGAALFGGKESFAGVLPADRIAAYEEVLDCLAVVGAEVIIRGVHKPSLKQRYASPFHPHDIALMFTCESVERRARRHDCRILLVADEAREVEDAALRDLRNYQRLGTTWGWRTEPIDHIVDTIHFVRSETSPAIQLADCVTFIASRQRKIDAGIVKPSQPVTDMWDQRIVPYLVANEVWYPPAV